MGLDVTDMGLEKKSGTHELKKHAATIHCSNTLSLLQRKISNALLYHAYKELMLKEEHEINIKQLCNLIAYNGNNHAAIKDALKGLLSTVIEWNLVNDVTGQEDWTASSILASVSLRGPTCFFAYSPRMKQLLHSPAMYGKINLFIQSRFKSSYGLALYENCIRYRGLPHTKWFEMELFRKLMGVPAGKYVIFRDFKRRVLDKSIEEVNTYSDLIVEAEIHREGRQIVKIRFNLKERAKKTRLGSATPSTEIVVEEGNEVKSRMINHYGLTLEQANEFITEYGDDFIADKMTIIESSTNYVRGRVKNLPAYLISALKNNYQNPKLQPTPIQTKKSSSDEKRAERIVNKVKQEYVTYREQVIDTAIQNLSEQDKQFFFDDFYQEAEESINTILKVQRGKYTHETVIHSAPIKALLRQFALQELQIIQEKLMTLEQFLELQPAENKVVWQQFHESVEE